MPNYQGLGVNRGFSTFGGNPALRDLLVFEFSQPVAHWGITGWDLESVADEPAIVRAYDTAGNRIFEREVLLPLQEDGDAHPNFIGVVSDRANLAVVTINAGNSAANFPSGAPLFHQAALLDLRFGTAALDDSQEPRAWLFDEASVGFLGFPDTLAAGTPLPVSESSAAGISSVMFDYEVQDQRLEIRHSGNKPTGFSYTIGPNRLVWVLRSGTRGVVTGRLDCTPDPKINYSLDIGADGTIDWTSSQGALDVPVTVDGTLPILVTMSSSGIASFNQSDEISFEAKPLIFDNGPVISAYGVGSGGADVSTNQHSWWGFFGEVAVDRWLADDFTICSSQGWTIDEVELTAYATGTLASVSAVSGVYLEFLDGPPGLGGAPVAGSPLPTANLLSSGLVQNVWSGAYRASLTFPTYDQLPLMTVRVRLPSPIQLAAGTYWIRYAFETDGPSGPFIPPITVNNVTSTGNARGFDNGVWQDLVIPGAGYSVGMPLRLYGDRVGSIGEIVPYLAGCSGADFVVEGVPNVGGFVHAEMRNLTPGAIPLIGVGLSAPIMPPSICGCLVGHDYTVLVAGDRADLRIPVDSTLCGVRLYLQGVEFLAGSCPLLPIELTDAYSVRIR